MLKFSLYLIIALTIISCRIPQKTPKTIKSQLGFYEKLYGEEQIDKASYKNIYYDLIGLKDKEENNICLNESCTKNESYFDKSGNIIEEYEYIDGNMNYKAEMKYDIENNLLEEVLIQFFTEYSDTTIVTHVHSKNDINKTIEVYVDSTIISKQIIEKSENIELFKKYEFDEGIPKLANTLTVFSNLNGQDSLHVKEYFTEEIVTKTQYWYDKHGNVIRNENFRNDKIISRGQNYYSNNLLTKTLIENHNNKEWFESEINYTYKYW